MADIILARKFSAGRLFLGLKIELNASFLNILSCSFGVFSFPSLAVSFCWGNEGAEDWIIHAGSRGRRGCCNRKTRGGVGIFAKGSGWFGLRLGKNRRYSDFGFPNFQAIHRESAWVTTTIFPPTMLASAEKKALKGLFRKRPRVHFSLVISDIFYLGNPRVIPLVRILLCKIWQERRRRLAAIIPSPSAFAMKLNPAYGSSAQAKKYTKLSAASSSLLFFQRKAKVFIALAQKSSVTFWIYYEFAHSQIRPPYLLSLLWELFFSFFSRTTLGFPAYFSKASSSSPQNALLSFLPFCGFVVVVVLFFLVSAFSLHLFDQKKGRRNAAVPHISTLVFPPKANFILWQKAPFVFRQKCFENSFFGGYVHTAQAVFRIRTFLDQTKEQKFCTIFSDWPRYLLLYSATCYFPLPIPEFESNWKTSGNWGKWEEEEIVAKKKKIFSPTLLSPQKRRTNYFSYRVRNFPVL